MREQILHELDTLSEEKIVLLLQIIKDDLYSGNNKTTEDKTQVDQESISVANV